MKICCKLKQRNINMKGKSDENGKDIWRINAIKRQSISYIERGNKKKKESKKKEKERKLKRKIERYGEKWA